MVDIVVYWRPGCGFCSALLRALERHDVPHARRDIWQDAEAAAEVRGGSLAPCPACWGVRYADADNARSEARRAGLEEMTFPGSTGAALSGVLHRPEGSARGSVLLAHCFTCSKDLHTVTRLAKALAAAGYAALRFDFTGLGESEGSFEQTTVSHDVRDLVHAATALIERGFGPCAMVGHSLGGAATLLAAERLKTVRSVAVVGAPSTPDHVRHLLTDDEDRIRSEGSAIVDIGGRPFSIAASFLDDLDRHDQQAAVAGLGRPLLVVHAVDDEVVPVTEGEQTFAAAAQPKSFVPLLHADHLVSSRSAANTLAGVLLSWLDQTLA